MGKLNSIFLRNSKGRLAGTTIYSTGGVTIQREIQTQVRNPRTKAQMTHRVKLANLVNMYQAAKPFFKKAFEGKKPLTSDYNVFVSQNLAKSQVYLTKQAAASGYFVPADYVISQGSLPLRATNGMGDGYVSGPGVPSNFTLSDSTTVAQLSQALISSNPGIVDGMQISFIRFDWTGGDKVYVDFYEMVLDSQNTTEKAFDYLTNDVATESGWLKLNVNPDAECAAAAFVWSHTIGGKTLVSSEKLMSFNLQNVPSYGDKAIQAAIDSYGQSEDVFLDSNNANKA